MLCINNLYVSWNYRPFKLRVCVRRICFIIYEPDSFLFKRYSLVVETFPEAVKST